ncbi:MAG: hypothetical protein B7Z80_18120 [Rhodospirillales bacterium 20-64-7]|nr:MAG: hypothetical protein B7Z80_18120 [Rhodospirillales bacterium 20-64-7]
MSLANVLAEDRRLIVLRALDESGFAANETVLKTVIESFGHHPTRDLVRADLVYMAEHGLIRLEKLEAASGQLWIAHLKTEGQEVAQGRVHPGIARREPS